jgi:hypothetical protein
MASTTMAMTTNQIYCLVKFGTNEPTIIPNKKVLHFAKTRSIGVQILVFHIFMVLGPPFWDSYHSTVQVVLNAMIIRGRGSRKNRNYFFERLWRDNNRGTRTRWVWVENYSSDLTWHSVKSLLGLPQMLSIYLFFCRNRLRYFLAWILRESVVIRYDKMWLVCERAFR